jgi:hypothetical protein
MQSVYIETAIPSYLTGRPSKQRAIADDQLPTISWRPGSGGSRSVSTTGCFRRFSPSTKQAAEDPEAAKLRLASLEGIRELEIPEGFESLEADIIALFRLPSEAVIDASHLALAVLPEMDYLLTWNCTHLATTLWHVAMAENSSPNQGTMLSFP